MYICQSLPWAGVLLWFMVASIDLPFGLVWRLVVRHFGSVAWCYDLYTFYWYRHLRFLLYGMPLCIWYALIIIPLTRQIMYLSVKQETSPTTSSLSAALRVTWHDRDIVNKLYIVAY